MNAAILNGPDTARMRSMGLGCGCGCNECGNKPLNGTMDYLFNTPQVGKKAIGVVSIIAFAYLGYKIFTL